MQPEIFEQEQPHLKDYLAVLRKRFWTVSTVFVLVVTLGVIRTFRTQPLYRATCQILIEKETSQGVSYAEAVGIETSQQDYYQTQYRLIRSRAVAQKAVERLKLGSRPEFAESKDTIGSFIRKIQVEPIRHSRLVDIHADMTDPGLAAAMANTLAEVYIEENIRHRVDQGALTPSSNGRTPWEQLDELSKNHNLESLPSVLNNPLIQSLKGEKSRIEGRYAELSKRYKEKHPRIIEIRAALESMEEKIEREMLTVVEGIRAELAGVLRGNNIRIVDRAEVPADPFKPNKRKDITVVVLLGMMGGAGLAFFLDYFDNTIKTKDEFNKVLGIPFLGHIPKIKSSRNESFSKKFTLSEEDNKSIVAEAFRNLRTNLTFTSASKKINTLMVTSSGPKEGKSTISSNLAIVLAHGGEKVLLVDADMRKPVIHRAFRLKNETGLSTYLSGESGFDGIVNSTDIKNLSVVTSGRIPPNPNELLGLPKMNEFLAEAGKKYDIILFDTPPVSGISDGLILSKKVDGVILAVRYKKLSGKVIAHGKERFTAIGSGIIGGVLNGFDIDKESGDYSYYSYYAYHQK